MFWDLYKRLFIALTITVCLILPAKSEDFSRYMSDVNEKIQNIWNPPEGIIEGHTEVVFKVDKTGNLLYYHIAEPSGNKAFDKSAVETIKKCPFNELPANSENEYITIRYSFDLHAADSEKMKQYAELAEKYSTSDKKLALKYLDMAIGEIKGDSISYFLYARRCKINKELGNIDAANKDLAEFKKLKSLNNEKRIKACKKEAQANNDPFAYFTLANAYEAAGDYNNALAAINQAINMTPLNHSYKRYRAEMIIKRDREIN